VSIKDPTDPRIQKQTNNLDHRSIPITEKNYLKYSEREELQSMSQLIDVCFFDIHHLIVLNKRLMNGLLVNKQQRLRIKHKTEVTTRTDLQTKIEAKKRPTNSNPNTSSDPSRYNPLNPPEGSVNSMNFQLRG
jgi:hypothetical protein